MFFQFLRADFLKTKRLSSIRMSHILIPFLTAFLFLVYYTYSPWDSITKIAAFFQIISIGLPFLIGLFCTLTAEQETGAGAFQGILAAPKRYVAFISKIVLLLSFEFAALLLSCGLFGTGYYFLLKETYIDYSFYWIVPIILLGSSIILYIWHLFLAFKFNKGVSIGAGIVETLLSALLLTGLGNGIWIYLPFAWGARFTEALLQRYTNTLSGLTAAQCSNATILCILLTIFSLFASVVWLHLWDGQKSSD